MNNTALNTQFGHVSSPRYVPQTFLERLHLLDSTLEPRWNPSKCRWEIWRQGEYILTVQSNSKQYRNLDNRVLEKLFLIDTAKYASAQQFIYSLHIEDGKFQDKKRKEQDDYVRSCHRDMAPMLRNRRSVMVKMREKSVN